MFGTFGALHGAPPVRWPKFSAISQVPCTWPVVQIRPTCPRSHPRPNNSKWYSRCQNHDCWRASRQGVVPTTAAAAQAGDRFEDLCRQEQFLVLRDPRWRVGTGVASFRHVRPVTSNILIIGYQPPAIVLFSCGACTNKTKPNLATSSILDPTSTIRSAPRCSPPNLV